MTRKHARGMGLLVRALVLLSAVVFFSQVTFGQNERRCLFDCDGDGRITVDEIIMLVNIALGGSIPNCPGIPPPEPGEISTIVTAINQGLSGCPISPTMPPPSVDGEPEGALR